MHKKSLSKRFLRRITLSLALIAFVFSFACAKNEGGGYHRKTPGEITRHDPIEKEVMRPGEGELAAANSPARKASTDMVMRGKKFLDEQKYPNALGLFQEAVIIDSANGVAYYYLAKTRFYLGQYEEAIGILEKAEALLSQSTGWSETIQVLRGEIQEKYYSNDTSY